MDQTHAEKKQELKAEMFAKRTMVRTAVVRFVTKVKRALTKGEDRSFVREMLKERKNVVRMYRRDLDDGDYLHFKKELKKELPKCL